MRRRPAIAFLLSVVVLVTGAVLFVRSQAAADLVCSYLMKKGSQRIGGRLTIGRCEVDPLSVELVFRRVSADVPWMGLSVKATRVRMRLKQLQGLSDELAIQALEIDHPVVRLRPVPRTVHPPSPAFAQARCTGIPMPFRLVDAVVRDADVSLDLGKGRSAVAHGVELTAHEDGSAETVHLATNELQLAGGGRKEIVRALATRLSVDPAAAKLRIDALLAESGDLRFSVKGTAVDMCKPKLDATVAVSGSLARLAALLGAEPAAVKRVRGRVALTGRLHGPASRPDFQGSLEILRGRVGHFRLGNARLEGRLKGDDVIVDHLVTDAMGGKVALRGKVFLAPGLPAQLDLDAHGATLEGLVAALGDPGSWAGGRIDAKASLTGNLWPLRLAGDAHAELNDFRVLDRAVARGPGGPDEKFITLPQTHVDGAVVFGTKTVEVPHARVTLESSQVTCSAVFPLEVDHPVNLKVDLDDVDLSEIGEIAGLPFSGTLSGKATMTGPYDEPHIAGNVEARGFEVDGLEAGVGFAQVLYDGGVLSLSSAHGQRGHTPYTIDRFALHLMPAPSTMDIQVSSDGGRVEDVVAALDGFHPFAKKFDGATGFIRGTVRLSGPKHSLTTMVDATATGGVLFGQPFQRLRVRGRLYKKHRYELDEVVANLDDDSRLTVRGYATEDGPLGLSVSARNVPLHTLEPVARLPVSGLLSGDMVVQGTWDHPKAHGGASLRDGTFRGISLRASRAQLSLDGSLLTVNGQLSGEALTGRLSVGLGPHHQFQANVALDEPTLEHWIPKGVKLPKGLEGWTGRARAKATLSGRFGDLRTYQGHVTFTSLSAHQGRFRIGAKGPVDLDVSGGSVSVRRLVLAGPSSTLTIGGMRAADGQLDISLHGGAEMGLLQTVLPRVSHASGVLHLEATVSGTFDKPVMVGSAKLDDASLAFEGAPISLTDLSGNIAFSQNRVLLEGLTGTAGAGRVTLGGEIALRRFLPQKLRVAANLDEVHLHVPDGLKSIISGEVYLDGKPDALALTGDVDVQRALYRRDLDIDQLLPTIRKRVAAVTIERKPWLHLDLGIHAPGTIKVEDRNLTATLRADLQLTGNDVHPGLLGTVSLIDGRAIFRGNEWRVTHALADFKDRDRIVPSFDVHAESDIRDYRVYVHAFGTPDTPRVTFTSDPDLAESDLVTLVTLGVTSRDAEGIGSGDAAAAAADALFAVSGLDQKVRSFIPKNPILRDPTLRLTSGYSSGTGQVEPRLAFESRLFTDQLRLRYSAPIGIPGQKTQAEYRINDTVSVQAEWDTENRLTPEGNLGLDLKLRWESE